MSDSKGSANDLKLSLLMRDWIPTWEHLDHPCGAKNLESQFVYANPAYKNLLSLPDKFNIEGRYDHEMPAPTSEFAEEFRYHDRLVEMVRERRSSLEINEFGPYRKLSAFFFDKLPLIDHKDHVIGTLFLGRRAVYLNTNFYLHTERPDSILLTKPSAIFTEKEWEIIFLMRQNLTLREIAERIQRTVNTVRAHFTSIFNKAGVNNKDQLTDFILSNGWGCYIPEKYMNGKKHILFNG